MTGTAEAISTINSLIQEYGRPLTLREVLIGREGRSGDDEAVAQGLDVVEPIEVEGVDEKIVVTGMLSGTFACRAMIAFPSIGSLFNRAGEGLTVIRARLIYNQTPTDYTEGGEASHTALYPFVDGEGRQLDAYFANLAAYEAAVDRHYANPRAGSSRAAGLVPPRMPQTGARYFVNAPSVPFFEQSDRSRDRLDIDADALKKVQAVYPETQILSSSSKGAITAAELPLLANWLKIQLDEPSQ